jgi:hypothetical protein
MVWLARDDLVRAKQLLQQHDARELMGKRDGAEGQAQVGDCHELRIEAQRTADDEAEIAPVASPLLKPASEIDARELPALTVEGANVGAGRYLPSDQLRLSPEQTLRLPGIRARLAQLADLDPSVLSQQPLVMPDVVRERSPAHPADTDDDDPHGAILG